MERRRAGLKHGVGRESQARRRRSGEGKMSEGGARLTSGKVDSVPERGREDTRSA